MNLTEAEDIKKRWQEYTEELYKKGLNDPDNHNYVVTHPEPDILECEVRWTLGSITMNKTSGGDGIAVELFHILKDDAVKVLQSICQQIWKTQQWSQDWKRSVFIPIPKKGHTPHALALAVPPSRSILLCFLISELCKFTGKLKACYDRGPLQLIFCWQISSIRSNIDLFLTPIGL